MYSEEHTGYISNISTRFWIESNQVTKSLHFTKSIRFLPTIAAGDHRETQHSCQRCPHLTHPPTQLQATALLLIR